MSIDSVYIQASVTLDERRNRSTNANFELNKAGSKETEWKIFGGEVRKIFSRLSSQINKFGYPSSNGRSLIRRGFTYGVFLKVRVSCENPLDKMKKITL